MNPDDLAKWYAGFYNALMETRAFTEEQAMAITLRTVPKDIDAKGSDPRKLIREILESKERKK